MNQQLIYNEEIKSFDLHKILNVFSFHKLSLTPNDLVQKCQNAKHFEKKKNQKRFSTNM